VTERDRLHDRPSVRKRDAPGATVAPVAVPTREAPAAAAAVLALQRSAGNAAAGAWLRSARAALVQRDRKLPDEPRSLADVSAVAKDITIDTARVGISGRARYFKEPRVKARKGIWVETRFGGAMAATATPDKEQSVRDGLGSLGMIMFGLDADRPKGEEAEFEVPGEAAKHERRPATADMTRIEELDLTAYGGKDGRYRFTAVARKGSGSAPTEVDLIVERLGDRRPQLKAWSELDGARRKQLEDRFRRHGFVKRTPKPEDKDPALPWTDDQWGLVLQALELIPEEMLQGVQGITWVRGHQPSAPVGETGSYETKGETGKPPVRTLIIYGGAFKSDETLIRLVAHEIGHAISMKPTEAGGAELADVAGDYQKAAKADSPIAVTKYGKKNWHEHYAEAYSMFIAQPETMKLLRPALYAWFEKQRATAAAAQAPAKPPGPKPAPADLKK
jgi:hypothetical protein